MKQSSPTQLNRCSGIAAVGALCALVPLGAVAFESGSTGADGAFNPGSSTTLALPPSGIFNYTDVDIPQGVTVRFTRNADNTPVRILASGDVTINGAIRVDGNSGAAEGGDGAGGLGGPGGFDGGRGGLFSTSDTSARVGGAGFGPGAGRGGVVCCSGAGGSFGTTGQNGTGSATSGPAYGNTRLLPLIGGSGGGGAAGKDPTKIAQGGGGGGGALLIAASGTVTVNGTISARGRGGLTVSGVQSGSGSGGAIRIVATTLQGEGTITAEEWLSGADGGHGRIRLEAENMLRTSNTVPFASISTPGVVLLANAPSIRIASVGGIAAPPSPTGHRDVVLPNLTTNPVAVTFETANVPVGTIISLSAVPERGTPVTVNSDGVTGTQASGTDSASIDLPNGNSVLTAQTTFTVTAASGDALRHYAGGERVEQVQLAFVAGVGTQATYISVTGKAYTWPPQIF